jgi:hypothetical protein
MNYEVRDEVQTMKAFVENEFHVARNNSEKVYKAIVLINDTYVRFECDSVKYCHLDFRISHNNFD